MQFRVHSQVAISGEYFSLAPSNSRGLHFPLQAGFRATALSRQPADAPSFCGPGGPPSAGPASRPPTSICSSHKSFQAADGFRHAAPHLMYKNACKLQEDGRVPSNAAKLRWFGLHTPRLVFLFPLPQQRPNKPFVLKDIQLCKLKLFVEQHRVRSYLKSHFPCLLKYFYLPTDETQKTASHGAKIAFNSTVKTHEETPSAGELFSSLFTCITSKSLFQTEFIFAISLRLVP